VFTGNSVYREASVYSRPHYNNRSPQRRSFLKWREETVGTVRLPFGAAPRLVYPSEGGMRNKQRHISTKWKVKQT
jgi:hypothetical protein